MSGKALLFIMGLVLVCGVGRSSAAAPPEQMEDSSLPIAPALVEPADYYVDAVRGNDGNNGCAGRPFRTIQKAVDAMRSPGSACTIRAGVYRETVRFHASGTPASPLRFQAEPGCPVERCGTGDGMDGQPRRSRSGPSARGQPLLRRGRGEPAARRRADRRLPPGADGARGPLAERRRHVSLADLYEELQFRGFCRTRRPARRLDALGHGQTRAGASHDRANILNDVTASNGRFTIRIAGGPGGVRQTIGGLKPRTEYILAAGVRPGQENRALYIGVENHGGEPRRKEIVMPLPGYFLEAQHGGGHWTLGALRFTTGPASTTAEVFAGAEASGPEPVFVDTLLVVPAEPWHNPPHQPVVVNLGGPDAAGRRAGGMQHTFSVAEDAAGRHG